MSYRPTSRGCCKASGRPNAEDRHWGHWRWLNCLSQARYLRALRIWNRLYGVRPRGLAVERSIVRLNLIREN